VASSARTGSFNNLINNYSTNVPPVQNAWWRNDLAFWTVTSVDMNRTSVMCLLLQPELVSCDSGAATGDEGQEAIAESATRTQLACAWDCRPGTMGNLTQEQGTPEKARQLKPPARPRVAALTICGFVQVRCFAPLRRAYSATR